MEIGYFTMPSHPPECGLKEGNDWDLQVMRWLDELGYQEAWVGEHHTAPWEPNPTPDLLIAQALMQTKNIRIGPGGFLLPYHHPAELANRVAMLDHLSEGRLNFGVAASGLPSDWAMFNVDGMSGQNRDMTREALEIILKLWTDPAPWTYKGKFWTVTKPDTMFDFLKPHIKPLQTPHPPIGVAGLSKNSDTLKLAGERGFIPMSLNLNPAYVGSHWESVEIGAAKTGRKPNRADWRLVREVFVADTDEEAWKLSTGDMMGRMMGEYFLPLLGHFGFKDYLKHTPDVPDSDVTVEYCAKRNWIVGSPATVAEKIEKIYDEVGGFGVLLVFGFDYKHKPEAWHHSLSLLKQRGDAAPEASRLREEGGLTATAGAARSCRTRSFWRHRVSVDAKDFKQAMRQCAGAVALVTVGRRARQAHRADGDLGLLAVGQSALPDRLRQPQRQRACAHPRGRRFRDQLPARGSCAARAHLQRPEGRQWRRPFCVRGMDARGDRRAGAERCGRRVRLRAGAGIRDDDAFDLRRRGARRIAFRRRGAARCICAAASTSLTKSVAPSRSAISIRGI